MKRPHDLRTPTRAGSVAVLMLAALTSVAQARDTLEVPGTYATIAAALEAATTGDTVLVQPGVYLEHDLDFGGKDLHLVSAGGAELTTIDAQGLGRHFWFQSGETQKAVLEGFTLANGHAPDGVAGELGGCGGSLVVEGASPSVVACRFVQCRAGLGAPGEAGSPGWEYGHGGPGGHGWDGGYGGAVMVFAGSPTFECCEFLGCEAGRGGEGGKGGPGYPGELGGCDGWPGCDVYGTNGGSGGPGGFGGYGGAVAVLDGSVTLRSCLIAAGAGGGAGPGGSGGAGGLHASNGPTGPLGVAGDGGAVWSSNGAVELLGCTVTGNSGLDCGGLAGPGGKVRSSIVRGNEPDVLPAEFDLAWCNAPGAAGVGNFDADPLFADPAAGNYHLLAGSPCLEAGQPGAPGQGKLDLDGQPRLVGTAPDLGADERLIDYPGTGEDLVLEVLVDGHASPWAPCQPAFPASEVAMTVASPEGAFVGAVPLLAMQARATGTALPAAPQFPGLWVNPNLGGLVLVSWGTTPLGPVILPPGGAALTTTLAPAVVGLTVRLQGLALSPSAANGAWASTDARELVIL